MRPSAASFFDTSFAKQSLAVMPPGLVEALGPILEQIAQTTLKIKQYDCQVQQPTRTEYLETQALLKVYGVGHLPAITYCVDPWQQATFQAKSGRWLLSRPAPKTQSVWRS